MYWIWMNFKWALCVSRFQEKLHEMQTTLRRTVANFSVRKKFTRSYKILIQDYNEMGNREKKYLKTNVYLRIDTKNILSVILFNTVH